MNVSSHVVVLLMQEYKKLDFSLIYFLQKSAVFSIHVVYKKDKVTLTRKHLDVSIILKQAWAMVCHHMYIWGDWVGCVIPWPFIERSSIAHVLS